MADSMDLGGSFGAGGAADALHQLLVEQRLKQFDAARALEGQQRNSYEQGMLGLAQRGAVRSDEAEARAQLTAQVREGDYQRMQRDPGVPATLRNAAYYAHATGKELPGEWFKPPEPTKPLVGRPGDQFMDPEGITPRYRVPESLMGVGPGGSVIDPKKPTAPVFTAPDRPTVVAPGHSVLPPGAITPSYTEPTRIVGADDPLLPRGAQRYISAIATKHGGDFNAARAELSAYLNDPQTRADHPALSPVAAMEALKQAASAPAGAKESSLDALIAQASANLGGGAPVAAGPRGAARGAVPGAVRIARVLPPGSAAAAGGAAPDAKLTERARQILQQGGYAATPENIQKFLNNPANRQRLATGGQ
jgi:hypothetical protein